MDNISHRRPHEGADMKYKTILDRIMHYVDRKANFGQTVSVSNAKRAINYAYGAGKQSFVDNIPDLEWNEEDRFGDFCECTEEGYSETPFGIYSILQWYSPSDLTVYFAGEQIKSNLQSVVQARQAANKDYKERLNKALGI